MTRRAVRIFRPWTSRPVIPARRFSSQSIVALLTRYTTPAWKVACPMPTSVMSAPDPPRYTTAWPVEYARYCSYFSAPGLTSVLIGNTFIALSGGRRSSITR